MRQCLLACLLTLAGMMRVGAEIIASGNCGADGAHVTWTLTDDGTLTISGEGEMGDYDSYPWEPWFFHRSSITKAVIEEGVTRIGSGAFSDCTALVSVVIPESVMSIGSTAFGDCAALASVALPKSLTSIENAAFWRCTALTSITIPENVTILEDLAFSGSNNLTSVVWNARNCESFSDWKYYRPFDKTGVISSFTFGDTVEHIPDLLCKGMNGLTSVIIPEGVKSIGENTFEDCTALTSVVWNARECEDFYSCPFRDSRQTLTSITFGDEVKCVPGSLCDGLDKLTSITLPGSVKRVGEHAFYGCSALTLITLPEGVEHIDFCAFYECNSLTSIVIPESVTSMGGNVFLYCGGLTSVTWNARNCEDFGAGFPHSPITSFTFGDAVEHVPGGLCEGLDKLTSVTFPESVKSIGSYAFYGCSALTSVTFPENLKSIRDYAFSGCTGLTEVLISEGLESMEDYAFYECSALTSVVWNSRACEDFSLCPFQDSRQTLISITFGDAVEHVPAYLCFRMDKLTSVTFSNSVQSIGEDAFYGCSALTSVTFPQSLQSIGEYAFAFCNGLTEITVHAVKPPEIVSSCFEGMNVSEILLYVPAEAVVAYKNDLLWGRFKVKALGDETGVDTPLSAKNGIAVFGREVTVSVNVPVSVYDAGGHCVLRTEERNFTLPAPGVYVVLAGSEKMKVAVR